MADSLKSRAFSGVRWTAISSVTGAVTQFVQLAILARLLDPSDFGQVAIVMIAVGFARIFSDAGVSAAIIHRQDATRDQLSSLYWLNIASGVVVFGVVLVAAPATAAFFDDERLLPLIRLAAFAFLVIPVGQQFQILLQRDLEFTAIAVIEVASTLAGAIAAIVAALAGLGAASLVLGMLLRAFVNSLLLFARGSRQFRPGLHFARSDLRGFVAFGLYQMGEKCVNFFHARADQLLIGKLLGATELGYYNLAYNLMIQPLSRINPIVTRVAFPVYARVQDDVARLRYGYFETRKYLALINFPLLVGLAALARPFVLAVYGPRWEPAVAVVEILALVGLLWVVGNPVGSLLLARGRADIGFRWNLVLFVVTPAAVYPAARHGIVPVCWALLAVTAAYAIAGYFFMVRRLIGPCARQVFVDTFLVPLSYAAVMGVLVRGIVWVLPLPDAWLLAAGTATGASVYLAILLLRERPRLRELRSVFT